MFSIYLVNFGWELQDTCNSFADALAKTRKSGYEAIIRQNGKTVAFWSPISGLEYK